MIVAIIYTEKVSLNMKNGNEAGLVFICQSVVIKTTTGYKV